MFYIHNTLERADHLRKDPKQIQLLRVRDDARLVPSWNNLSLVSSTTSGMMPQALLLPGTQDVPAGQSVFLGLRNTQPVFAVDISALSEQERDLLAEQALDATGKPQQGEFADLRTAGPTLPYEDGSLLAYARALMIWNGDTRFCSHCGQPMISTHAGHIRECSNEHCHHLEFPRTDPAVIMLVSHVPDEGGEPKCLLGRSPAWPEGVYSTLAGFVEPGETLENAVRREVMEEASIKVSEVRYVASQPWPFPRSIMLGFEATAISTKIICDPTEIADAHWFTRQQLTGFGSWGDTSDNFKLPRKDSIARFLIERWMTQVETMGY